MILQMLSPTLNFELGDIGKLPLIEGGSMFEKVDSIVEQTEFVSKEDWDSFETSWDFTVHPLV